MSLSHTSETTKTFYITKYALTTGVKKLELYVYVSPSGFEYPSQYTTSVDGNNVYLIGKEAFENIEDAIANVNERKATRIKSIEKELAKLNNTNYEEIIRSLY